MFFDSQESGLVENVNIGIYSDTIDAITVKLCMMVHICAVLASRAVMNQLVSPLVVVECALWRNLTPSDKMVQCTATGTTHTQQKSYNQSEGLCYLVLTDV